MSARAERRRAAKANAKVSRHNLTDAGATALDAIRVNGRDVFFAKTFALMKSDDPQERAAAEFMLRGAWEALSCSLPSSPTGEPQSDDIEVAQWLDGRQRLAPGAAIAHSSK
jgi:hypothetical protein